METYSALLVLCAGNSSVTGEFPSQRPVTRSFDVFFDLRLNKRLSKHAWDCWIEKPSRSLWRLCNDFFSCFPHLRLMCCRITWYGETYTGMVFTSEYCINYRLNHLNNTALFSVGICCVSGDNRYDSIHMAVDGMLIRDTLFTEEHCVHNLCSSGVFFIFGSSFLVFLWG